MDDASGTIKEIVKSAGNYGPDVFLSVIILIIGFGFLGFYLWKVVIPNAESDRKTAEEMAKVIAALGTVVGEIRHIVESTDKTTGRLNESMADVVRSVIVAISVLERVMTDAKVSTDMKSELGQIKGMLARWTTTNK